MLTMADERGGEVGEMLTMADKGWVIGTPPFLADIICEQPLRQFLTFSDKGGGGA